MASNTSSWYSISGHSSRKYRAYVNAYVKSETDTTATIYVEGCVQAYYLSQYGAGVGVYINGQWVDGASVAIMNSSGETGNWGWASGTLTIDKSSYGKSITCTCSVWGETVSGYGGLNGGNPSTSVTVSVSAITIYEPNEPSDLTNTRESDNKNVLTWEAPSTSATQPVSAILIERSVDGGAWSQIESVSGDATSYNDTSTSADHSYAYRIRSQNSEGESDYVTSGTTYNTPSAPAGVTASRLAETTVKLEIANTANTATALELQRSEDALSWADIPTVEGSPVTETTDEPFGGTFYYRARNTRGELVSDWSPVSNAVVTICSPAAPTLKTPASGMVVSKAQETIIFEHAHNPIDGSNQRAAQYRFSTDKGATYDYIDIEGDAQKLEMENAFAVNAEVTWGVRTKGAHDDYGPWSDNRVFFVYQAPSVAFAQPTDGFVVENTPIHIALQYVDPSGTLANAMFTISDEARTVYTRNMGTAMECDILAKEWTPDNGKVYTLTVQVRSSSSLSASAIREISVDFVLPQLAGLYIENGPDTGYASLVVYVEEDEALEVPASISVWRESEDGRVLLDENLQAGAGVVDKYAPLNTDYKYIVKSFADSGAVSSQEFENRVSTDWSFMYFNGDMARCKWNPRHSLNMSPSVEFVHYMGDTWPTPHMDDFLDQTVPVTALVIGREESRAFRRMMMAREPVVAKLWRGDVFWAVPSLNEEAQQGRPEWWEISVDLTRSEGDAL